ncbi:mucosal pentraxin-like isoform X1 [Meleagris gallopavo]|uniref:mucosal pentraxin-like isoform X1 n=1 Tax=Meleagris gallopavo TaxID=9103 RepID=UPI000549BB50|nr:mucosal pentraxin-like isoform X1 [Meleagris gallopavo]
MSSLGKVEGGSQVAVSFFWEVPWIGASAHSDCGGDMETTRFYLLFFLVGLCSLAAPGGRGAAAKLSAQIQSTPQVPSMYHSLVLSCKVTGDTGPKEFVWEKKGIHKPLQRGPSDILLFRSLNATHLGIYTCKVTSPRGSAVATYNLWINDLKYKVFVFPEESNDSLVLVQARPEHPLLNFTVCLRSYTDLTRPYSLFSYATKEQDNEIVLLKFKPTEYRFYVGGKYVAFRVPESHMESEHVCVTWESPTGIVRFWLNKNPWPRKGLQKGYEVGNEAVVVLGQEQDAFGGGFDAQQSFVGEISDVYMWDVGLSNSEVKMLDYSEPYANPIFGWRNFPYKIEGEVYLVS